MKWYFYNKLNINPNVSLKSLNAWRCYYYLGYKKNLISISFYENLDKKALTGLPSEEKNLAAISSITKTISYKNLATSLIPI